MVTLVLILMTTLTPFASPVEVKFTFINLPVCQAVRDFVKKSDPQVAVKQDCTVHQ